MRFITTLSTTAALLGILLAVINPTRAQTVHSKSKLRLNGLASSYVLQLAGSQQTEDLHLQLSSDVRRAVLRFNTLSPVKPAENRLLAVELFETSPEGEPLQKVSAGQLVQIRNLERLPDVYRVLWFTPGLAVPRKDDVHWLVRIRSLPLVEGREPLPVQVGIEIHTDATPLTNREKELIAWRETIKDPLAQVALVREKVITLTDEEVRRYTGFDTRDRFLQYWMRSRMIELQDTNGKIAMEHRPGYRGLTSPGKPLPNGKYFHHNGTVPLIPD